MTHEVEVEQFIRLIALMRRNGASVRALAKCCGMSKSKMGRWVQAIDASQLGQPGENLPDIATVADADLSQMGQADGGRR